MPLHATSSLWCPAERRHIDVDVEMAPLIGWMWRRGIRTIGCCQAAPPGDHWAVLPEDRRPWFIPEELGGRVVGEGHLTMEGVVACYNERSARAHITFAGVVDLEAFLHRLPVAMQRRVMLPGEDPARWDAHFAHVEREGGVVFTVTLDWPYADTAAVREHLEM